MHPHRWPHQNTSPASLIPATHHPHQPCQKSQRWPAPPHVTVPGSPRVDPARLPDEVLQLKGQMNTALEWLLTTRATMDSHCRELELNAKLAMHMNEVQATKAIKEAEMQPHSQDQRGWVAPCTTRIKEAEVCCTTNSCVLQQTHGESMLALKQCKAIAEEGWDCCAFVEASVVALLACLHLKPCGAMIYPLQLLTGNVPLAYHLGNAGCHPTTGCTWQRTNTSSFHP